MCFTSRLLVRTWLDGSSGSIGSVTNNCSTRLRLAKLRRGRCLPLPRSLAICSGIFQARRQQPSESPSFIFIAIIGPLVPLLRRSAIFGAFLDGVNVGALALMAVVTWQLGRAALIDLTTVALAVLSAIGLIRFKINSTWLILAGGIIGFAAQRIAN